MQGGIGNNPGLGDHWDEALTEFKARFPRINAAWDIDGQGNNVVLTGLPINPFVVTGWYRDLLDRTGVVVGPGSGFGKAGEGYVRVALCVSEERLKLAARRMADAGFRY